MRVLAVDVGTAAVRVGLFDEGGQVVGIERQALPQPDGRAEGSAEQDPAAWWAAVVDMSRSLVAAHGSLVDAVCVVGQGPTCVATAEDGSATRRAITWRDRRMAATASELTSATGAQGWDLGLMPAALWTARHDAAAAAGSRWYLGTWEWLAFRLTGVVGATARPSDDVLASAAGIGLEVEKFPQPIATGELAGSLTPDAASQLGLAAGVPVVAGTFDAAVSVIGAGLTEAGQAIDVGGAAGGFAVMTDSPMSAGPYGPLPSLLPDRWLLGGAMAATGSALDWLVWNVLDGAVDRDTLVAEAADVEPGSGGLLFLPYLAGERDPINDPAARGAFVGLTLVHRRAHLARAIMEAAAFALRHVASPILEAGISVSEMRVAGGPARSDVWNRIKADVMGFPVFVPVVRETALVGAAILAQAAISGDGDLAARARSNVHIEERIAPRQAHREVYDRAYARYIAVYPPLARVVGSEP